MRQAPRLTAILFLLAAVPAALASIGAAPASSGQLRAGAAAVDASWHVGASAGQYASDGTFIGDHGVDPTGHSVRRAASYGIQSRLEARAIVIEGSNGQRVAVVKNDLYIPQDLLYRRTAELLEQGDSGITRANLTMAVTHDHSSPYYSSTSWGVWTFQDVFDVRFFDYYAKRMALAVERAAADLKPVRVGASVSHFDKTHRHSFGPAIADDGTPAGYPLDNTDHDMTVIRFDDVSDPANPRPLANLVNFGLHGEGLNGNDLISADWVGPLQRMSDRETGALTIYTQSAVGTSEPERSTYHSVHDRLEFSHREYAQDEYAARLMTDSIVKTWRDIQNETPEDPSRFIGFDTSSPVATEDRWFPGPLSHPYPGVSNCRADKAFEGDPQFPVVGLPDCEGGVGVLQSLASFFGLPRPPDPGSLPIDPGLSTDDVQSRGIPLPENYSAPSYASLQEDVSVHLQAFRIGDILFTVCSCEQWYDQSKNIKTRTNRTQGDMRYGYDWGALCTDNGDGTWTCPNPNNPSVNLPPISDHNYQRMRAQVNNDAAGWNDPENVSWAESEPTDTTQIKGNYTHQELSPELGYRLTVAVSMANDYNGYIATYREYQRGDHYRKALTGWGPHSSDYMATRLVQMGGHLNGGADLPEEIDQPKVAPDLALNDQRAEMLGEIGGTSVKAYEASLPDDGGTPAVISQPAAIERFSAAFFKWNGGSNFTDNPFVQVQRLVDGQWVKYDGQDGEIPVTLEYPQGEDVPSYLFGNQQWRWTAHFEAFASNFDTIEGNRATPEGTYKFVVDGQRRESGQVVPYHLESNPFLVNPWSGITVDDIRYERNRLISFMVGPRHAVSGQSITDGTTRQATIGPIDYPDSYSSPARFIKPQRNVRPDPDAPNDPSKFEWYCFACSFRPWADTGDADVAYVTIVHRNGTLERARARPRGDRWAVSKRLLPGEVAYVAAGDAVDSFGNVNGAASKSVRGRGG